MRRKRRLFGILLIITALIIMQLPVSEADAKTSASDFKMEGTTLVKYLGTEKNVSVPDAVEVIGEEAFEGNTLVELVVLPKSVKKIEAYAFWECENLKTVVIGSGMTEIGDYAFANCKGLVKMSIPENIRSIGIQAFMDCVNLADIAIAPEVTDIHETAFDGCYKLTIHCEKGSTADKYATEFYERQKEMPEYEDVDDYQKDEEDTTIISPTPTPGITVTEQGEILGDSKVVGNHAVVFVDSTELQVMSGNVLESEQQQTGDSNEEYKDEDTRGLPKYTIVDDRIVADQAYYKSNTLNEVILPQGIEEIGQFSFARSSINKIWISNRVKNIGYGAFYHCDSLTELQLPESVETVEPNAFTHTRWVDDFLANGTEDFLVSGGVLVAYGGHRSSVKLPEDVRVIAAEVFANHQEITEVILPDSLLTVGEGAFEGCTNLSVVVMGKQVERIKDRAFANCKISNIMLPETLKELGIGAIDEVVKITYAGTIPVVTHELSAERLSNEVYRNLSEESGEIGVNVSGLPGASAKLEGAVRSYELSVKIASNNSGMERAYSRCYQSNLPTECLIYDLNLTDSSGIPITKLGKQMLQITLPISDYYASRKLEIYSLDRNGQLELIEADRVRIDGTEYLRFELDFVAQIGIIGHGVKDGSVVILEESTTVEKLSEAPAKIIEDGSVRYTWILGGGLMLIGLICLIWKKREYR